MPEIRILESPVELAHAGARIIISTAQDRITKTDRFVMAISGGSSPGVMHKLLTTEPYLSEIQWNKTHIFWVDDRCVPEDSPFSNYGSAKREFLDQVPIPIEHVHSMPTELPPEEGAVRYQRELMSFFHLKEGELPALDLTLLGIGPDGHTASLFPGHNALNEIKRMVVYVKGGNPDIYRLTLTFPVLNNAEKTVFFVSGRGKAEIVERILKHEEKMLPARMVQPLSGELIWLLDRDAAALL